MCLPASYPVFIPQNYLYHVMNLKTRSKKVGTGSQGQKEEFEILVDAYFMIIIAKSSMLD